jgi:hypothetical protein
VQHQGFHGHLFELGCALGLHLGVDVDPDVGVGVCIKLAQIVERKVVKALNLGQGLVCAALERLRAEVDGLGHPLVGQEG